MDYLLAYWMIVIFEIIIWSEKFKFFNSVDMPTILHANHTGKFRNNIYINFKP